MMQARTDRETNFGQGPIWRRIQERNDSSPVRGLIDPDSARRHAGFVLIFFAHKLLQHRTQVYSQRRKGGAKMTNFDEQRLMVRRNKLLGMWAADKLGLKGAEADAYSDDLAMDAVDPERNDVLKTIRKDFQAKGVVQSDEAILAVMNDSLLRAARQVKTRRRDGQDAAALMIARNLTSR
jgi:hypothetical protein